MVRILFTAIEGGTTEGRGKVETGEESFNFYGSPRTKVNPTTRTRNKLRLVGGRADVATMGKLKLKNLCWPCHPRHLLVMAVISRFSSPR